MPACGRRDIGAMLAGMKRVALALDLSQAFHRKIAEGVAQYGPASEWSIYIENDPAYRLPRLAHWDGDGIIANLGIVEQARAIRRMGIPVVGVGGIKKGRAGRRLLPGVPYVASDDEGIGRRAAVHLLEHELRHLAYCGYRAVEINDWSVARGEAFGRTARAAGAAFHVLRARFDDPRRWDRMMDELSAWLRSLPKPVGILAADDARAHHVIEAARLARLPIPRRIAVLGVDNDFLACTFSQPPLTSIDPNAEAIGRAAAAVLHALMRGRSVPEETVIPPAGLEPRASTRVYIDRDPLVRKAMETVGTRLSQGILAAEAAEACGVSLVTLNKRFRAARGMSVSDWIRRARLREIERLLDETELPLRRIAERAGVSSVAYLCRIYREAFGRRPRQAGKPGRPKASG